MKKTLPLLSLIVALGACDKQPEYIMNENAFCGYRKELACKDKNAFCDNYTETFVCEDANGKKITGRVAHLYSNGQKQLDFFVKNGVATGFMQNFYPGGTVKEQMNFKNGKLHGIFKEFGKDGKTISVTTFRMGEDIESTRYKDGVVIGRVYSADGITKYYDNNGRLTSESKMFINKNNDNKEITKEYDENGSLKKISYSILKEINVNEQISATEEPEYVMLLVGEEEYKGGKLDGMRIRYKPMAEGKQVLYSEEWK